MLGQSGETGSQTFPHLKFVGKFQDAVCMALGSPQKSCVPEFSPGSKNATEKRQ
jgi:hypothetical protein